MQYRNFAPRTGVTIAHYKTEGIHKNMPGVLWLGGFRSDMTGTKAVYLEEECKKRGQGYVRFDYRGHGVSSGRFEDLTLSSWLQDAQDVLDHLTSGRQIIVGSSMGGWLALLLALKRPLRMAGLILIAAAPDFTDDVFHLEFGEKERRELAERGHIMRNNAYGDPYPLTRALFDDGKKHMLLKNTIDLRCPVRLIHGREDPDVPWQKSEKIRKMLASRDVETQWIDDGDHRLSRPQDLAVIGGSLAKLTEKLSG